MVEAETRLRNKSLGIEEIEDSDSSIDLFAFILASGFDSLLARFGFLFRKLTRVVARKTNGQKRRRGRP